jgi:pimeloyl-ACP methyl ester carboxylesterase
MKGQHRIIRLDLPAYGLTGPNKNHDYSSKYYVAFLHNFLQKLNVRYCYLAGNSLGGKITWDYALNFPNEVKKMILIDAAGYPSKKLGGALVFKLAQLPYIKHIFTKITPKFIIEKSMLDVYGDDSKVTQQLIDQYHDMSRREGNRAAFVSRTKIKFDQNYKRIPEIKIPTLLLWGELDRWITIENAYQFQKDLPNDTLIIYKGVGHVPMEEIPEKTAEDSLDFLKK